MCSGRKMSFLLSIYMIYNNEYNFHSYFLSLSLKLQLLIILFIHLPQHLQHRQQQWKKICCVGEKFLAIIITPLWYEKLFPKLCEMWLYIIIDMTSGTRDTNLHLVWKLSNAQWRGLWGTCLTCLARLTIRCGIT